MSGRSGTRRAACHLRCHHRESSAAPQAPCGGAGAGCGLQLFGTARVAVSAPPSGATFMQLEAHDGTATLSLDAHETWHRRVTTE